MTCPAPDADAQEPEPPTPPPFIEPLRDVIRADRAHFDRDDDDDRDET